MAGDRVPVVLCIDVEPDPRLVSVTAPEPWRGYERVRAAMEDLRARLGAATGAPARFAWFLRLDEQIERAYGSRTWIIDEHRGHLDAVREHGDALGVHPHPYRWLTAEQTWLADFASPVATGGSLEASVADFERTLGEPCRLLRFGDRWLDTRTVARAERLGIRVDLTTEPGTPAQEQLAPGERSTGALPDYRNLPCGPYTPDLIDFRRPAPPDVERSIQMLPLTSVTVRTRRPWHRVRTPLAPWRTWTGAHAFGRMIDQVLAASPRPYLAMAVRAGDWESKPVVRANVEAAFSALVAHPAARRFVVCPPEEALEILGQSP